MEIAGLFVIPYRDRADHLYKWVKRCHAMIENPKILVVEQADDKPFARAPLFNCAFIEEGYKYPYCIYHDVDMILDTRKSSPEIAYSYPVNPTHIATRLHRSGYNAMYENFFGGVVLMSTEQMERTDGWHSQIFGWGVEDDAQRDRIVSVGMKVDKRDTYFLEEKHDRKVDGRLLRSNLQLVKEEWRGMSHQSYVVVSREEKDLYLHIKVSF